MRTLLIAIGSLTVAALLVLALGAAPQEHALPKGDWSIETVLGDIELISDQPSRVLFEIDGPRAEGAEFGACADSSDLLEGMGLEVSTGIVESRRVLLSFQGAVDGIETRDVPLCLLMAEEAVRRTFRVRVHPATRAGLDDPRFAPSELPLARTLRALPLSDGRIWVLGETSNGENRLLRLTASGVIDRTFGESGQVSLGPDPVVDFHALASGDGALLRRSTDGDRLERIFPDGRVVAWPGRFSVSEPTVSLRVTQPFVVVATGRGLLGFRWDGRRDLGFGVGGEVTHLGPWNTTDGGLIARLREGPRTDVYRHTASGDLDRTFAGIGFRRVGFRPRTEPVMDEDGSMVLVGSSPGICPEHILVRLDARGQLDGTFGLSGVLRLEEKCPERIGLRRLLGRGWAVFGVDPDGGAFVSLLDASGKIETGFGDEGTVSLTEEPLLVSLHPSGDSLMLIGPSSVRKLLI